MTDRILIKKVNEVVVKIFCSPSTAQELSDEFTFTVPNAKFHPKVRAKVWDGKIRLFNMLTREIYAGLVPAIEEFAASREYEVEYEYESGDEEFSLKEAEEFIESLNLPHVPREYQIEAFIYAMRKKRAVLLSPTSSGKSLIIYMLTRAYAEKTLIIVPTVSLVHQMASDFRDYGYKGEIHTITSGSEKNSNARVTISTWQSIYKMPKEFFQQFKVVFGDEAHLFKATSLVSIMTKLTDCSYRFGLTGTLDGSLTNKLVLEGLFGKVRKVTTTSELMEQGHVSQLLIKALVLNHSPEDCDAAKKYTYQEEMDFLVRNEKRNKFIKNLVLSLDGGNTLVLYQYVEKHGDKLFEMIKKETDRPVYYVHGGVDGEERDEIRSIVEKEDNAIIIASYGTFSTGINIKRLHNLIFASPSKSIVRILQSIGRILRKADDKIGATLFDIADNLSHKSNVNYTLNHFKERIKIYSTEGFEYKIYKVNLK